MVGDHPYIFRDCLQTLSFWMGIKNEIDTILGINITLTPSQFLFDLAPDSRYSRNQKHLRHILLTTARKTVTEVDVMEALTAKIQLRSDVFGRRRLPIEKHLLS